MKNRKHTHRKRTGLIAAAVLFLFSAFVAAGDDLFLISKNLDIFAAVYRQISVNYVDETDPEVLVRTAVDAMLDDLDPYTEYVREADVATYKLKYVDTKYAGIGAAIFVRDGRIYLSELYAGHPADQAGLQVGDELLRINEIRVEHKSAAEVSQLLRGAEHSDVRLEVRKNGQEGVEALTITRELIRQPNVSHVAWLDHGIGYIKLDKFLERSSQEMEEAVRGFQKKDGFNGLIIDLRNNGGGILQEAVKIVNLFVPPGEAVVSQKGKNVAKANSYRTTTRPLAPEIPLVILINGHSASAAEIVAGALQDLDRAVVIGERSFGKGLVQQTFTVPYNNLVKVTVAKYYTPSGRCIQSVDYVHKDSNGHHLKVSDSLIHAFHTKNGRVVYDGSGIYPDLVVEQPTYSPITQTLRSRWLLFDYATTFRQQHRQIASPDRFELSETGYREFIRFLDGKDYDYFTQTEAAIQQLKGLAEAERKPAEILDKLDELARQVYQSKQHDLLYHREEIREVLGAELVSRYYYAQGRSAYLLKRDKQVAQAQALLAAPDTTYYSILAGEGKYRTIGRPETFLAVTE